MVFPSLIQAHLHGVVQNRVGAAFYEVIGHFGLRHQRSAQPVKHPVPRHKSFAGAALFAGAAGIDDRARMAGLFQIALDGNSSLF